MPPPRYRSRPAAALPTAAALLPRCRASIATAVAVLPMPPPTPSTSPQPVHPLALALALALATAPASGDRRHRRQPLSPITVVVVAAVAAAVDAAATTPSPLPPPSLSLQPLPMSLRLQRSCRWLAVVSSVAPRLLRCPPFEFISPRHRAIVDAFAAGPPSPFAYHCQPLSCRSFTEDQSLSPLPLMVGCCILRPPSSIPTTSPSRKRFQFPPSWTYFDLLRVSTCLVLERLQNLRGCK